MLLADIVAEVHPDGSPDMRFGLGANSELAGFAGLSGHNWFEEWANKPGAQIEKQVAGGMEWQCASLTLDSLETLEERLDRMEWGDASLTKQNGIVFNTFHLRVQGTEPLLNEEDAEQYDSELFGPDPSGHADLTWELILPGEIVGHSCSNIDRATDQITLYLDISEPLSIYASSPVFNTWIVPVAVVILLCIFATVAGVLVIGVTYWKKSRSRV